MKESIGNPLVCVFTKAEIAGLRAHPSGDRIKLLEQCGLKIVEASNALEIRRGEVQADTNTPLAEKTSLNPLIFMPNKSQTYEKSNSI